MGIVQAVKGFLERPKGKITSEEVERKIDKITVETCIRKLAFWTCVNLIANTMCKVEFKTYFNGEEIKEKEHYIWNLEPNKNQNGSEFIQKLIAKLYSENEVLIIEFNDDLFVADSFHSKEYVAYKNVYSQVTIGDFELDGTYIESDVLHLKLNNEDMRRLTKGLYEMYRQLIDLSIDKYRKTGGEKGILKVDTYASGQADFQEKYSKIKNEYFRKMFEAENGIVPLYDGYDYKSLGNTTTNNALNTRDIRALIDDITEFTAKAFNIPPVLANGTVQDTEKARNQFLTDVIKPLCNLLEREINRKRYGYAGFKAGSYIKIDTKGIKYIDLLDVSAAIDKLISSGAFTVNDIRVLTGQPRINEPWADQHFMTKNYATIEELLIDMKGGEKGEE